MKKILILLCMLFAVNSSKAALPMGGVYLESCFLYDDSSGKITLRATHHPPNSFGYYWDSPFTTWAYVRSGATIYGPFIVSAIIPTPTGTMDPPLTYYEVSIPGFSTQACYEVWYTSNRPWYYDDPTNSWGYTPAPGLDPLVPHVYHAPNSTAYPIPVTEVYNVCICEDSDTMQACNSNFKLNISRFVTPPPYLLVDLSCSVTLYEYHPTSSYFIDWGLGLTPYSSMSSSIPYLSPSGSYTVCIVEITSSGDSCKSCMNFCIPEPDTSFSRSAMKKTKEPAASDNNIELYPNPAHNETELRFSLSGPETVSGIISDISGKKIMDIPSRVFNAGIQKIGLNTQSLPAGIYRVQVSIGNKINTKKLSVIK